MNKPYYTNTFAQIDPQKQERILLVAIEHFAEQGFNGASINKIAREAEISIGSLYSYFPSKKELFLTLIEQGYELLDEALYRVDFSSMNLEQTLSQLVETTIYYSKTNKRITQIYLDLSTQGLSDMAHEVSQRLEADSVAFYRQILLAAQQRGEVGSEVNLDGAAFFIDTTLMSLQQAYASNYYRERMKLFMGQDVFDDETQLTKTVVRALMKVVA